MKLGIKLLFTCSLLPYIEPSPAVKEHRVVQEINAKRAQRAADRLRALLAAQGEPVSEGKAAQDWEKLKKELDREDDKQIHQWLASSQPR